ncbi:MAG: DUF11 domain-containing protein [Candidatus Roizmanbacteria bacterium]
MRALVLFISASIVSLVVTTFVIAAPTEAAPLVVEKRIVSSENIEGGKTRISYMITVKNSSTTEDVENVQITDDINADQGPVSLVSDSLYGINLGNAQLDTGFNGGTMKKLFVETNTSTGLTLSVYPSSNSYVSVMYAVTYQLGSKDMASLCNTAEATGTTSSTLTVTTASNQKCINITPTPTLTPTNTPTATSTPSLTPTPTAPPSATATITPSAAVTTTPTPIRVDLKLTKSANKSKVKIGDTIEFTVTVANESAVTALNVKVKDLLTSSFAYISHETTYGQYNHFDGIWTIGNLNALSTQTLTIKALIANKDSLNSYAEVYQVEQSDSDSTPNNCDNGNNKEDDCSQVTLSFDGNTAGVVTKGGILADTGNSLIAPLIFGILGFGALFIILRSRSKHAVIIQPVGVSGAKPPSFISRLLAHQVIAGGVLIGSALLVGASIINVANTVRIAQLQRSIGSQESNMTLVGAAGETIAREARFDCSMTQQTEISVVKDENLALTLVNTSNTPAYITIPGYDVLAQSGLIDDPDAPDDFIYEVTGERVITFFPKTTGSWYLTNASYCKKLGKTNSFNIQSMIVADAPPPTAVPPTAVPPTAVPSPTSTLLATGGDKVEDRNGYRIHTFTSSGAFITNGSGQIEYLIVAGGGGGGNNNGGGGGGGGFISNNSTIGSPGAYFVVIGEGGTANGGKGGDSSFAAAFAAGGGGGGTSGAGSDGGSGGGGTGGGNPGGLGDIPNWHVAQGYNGGGGILEYMHNPGGGGGGAGGVGLDGTSQKAGDGGPGQASDISGDTVYYAGGGGGGIQFGTAGSGRNGGGNGGANGPGTAGADNTGGGGGSGGGSFAASDGGKGGSGIVIIRYRYPAP